MISSLHLNKFIIFVIFFTCLFFISVFAEDEPVDIWENKEIEQNEAISSEAIIKSGSSILSDNQNNNIITIDEDEIESNKRPLIGIFDPADNNFNLNMWVKTDGEEIKKALKRIDKLKLSKSSEDLLFQILFTNAYAPNKNLNATNFLNIKVNWLIKNRRINDLEVLLKNNLLVGKNSKAIKFLINEYLSSADVKSACDKINFIDRNIKNNYLEKFKIYCLINNDQKEEAQLIFDLLKEGGFKDNFFEDKINFLTGITETTTQKIVDNNLLNFYLSYITSKNFEYQPSENTDKYIWKYLSSANLIKVNNFEDEDEDVIMTYETAASQNSFDQDEIFKIYLQMSFNFNQLVNAEENYKNLPNYKGRALIYQSILLSDNYEKKINLAFLLKDLFIKDKIFNIYSEEFLNILKAVDRNQISESYAELIDKNLDKNFNSKVKFDNDILHRSKVIKHFLENNQKLTKTEKDFKSVYKKIKKNKKYFISIKDIIVLESLLADGLNLPQNLNYTALSSELTIPQNLKDLVTQNEIGLLMLKIVEIIGEDNIRDLDPETLYFLTSILNQLKLKKIRNNILSEALPVRT